MEKSPSSIRCNLCGNTHYHLVHREKKTSSRPSSGYTISENHLEKPDQIVRCMTCHLVYAVPKEPLREIVADYVHMADPDYVQEEAGRRAQARLILHALSK